MYVCVCVCVFYIYMSKKLKKVDFLPVATIVL